MKTKCSFILKASLSLVLAMLMIFGTVTTSLAAVVDNLADTGAEADLAESGADTDLAASGTNIGTTSFYFRGSGNSWGSTKMTKDKSGYFSYYKLTAGAQFKIVSTNKAEDWTQIDADYGSGFWGLSGVFTMYSGNNWLTTPSDSTVYRYKDGNTYPYHSISSDTGDNLYIKNAGYVVVWYANTELRAFSKPMITVVSSLPTHEPVYKVTGYTSGWTSSQTFIPTSTLSETNPATHNTQYTASVTLPKKNTNYEFKIQKYFQDYPDFESSNSNYLYYGYNDTITKSNASTSKSFANTVDNNAKITSDSIDGLSYTFKINSTAWYDKTVNLTVTYPTIYTVTFNANGHGTAPAAQNVVSGGIVTKPTDLTATGYTFGGWYKEPECTNAWDFSTDTVTKTTTLYAKWTEKTSTLTVNTDGNGTLTKTGTTSGISSNVNVTAVSANSGYVFSKWVVSGTDASHVRIKNSSGTQIFNGTTWSGTGDTTQAIKIYTDGSAANLSATVQATFASSNRTYYVGTMLKDDTGDYTIANATDSSNTSDGFTGVNTKIGSSTTSATVNIGSTASLTTKGNISATDTQNSVDNNFSYVKYKFMGWKSYSSAQTSIPANNSSWDSTSASYSPSVTASSNQYWYAVYKKYYVFCAYNSYDHAQGKLGNNILLASPPTKYKNGSATATAYPSQGKKFEVAAGDNLVLTYSALATSDCIDTVFYDNETDYTTATPTPANFTTDPPQLAIGTDCTVDNGEHTITIPMVKDVKNITIAVGTKYRVFFSDTENALIQSKNIDDFYTPGEAMSGSDSTKFFTIKAAGNADQVNNITAANITVYSADANGNKTGEPLANKGGLTFTYSSGSNAISNSDGTASTRYIKIGGSMPNQNIYIDLGVEVSYKMYLDSKIVSDDVENKTKFRQVASITVKNGTSTFQSLNQSDTAGDRLGPKSLTKGTSLTYSYTFSGSYSSWYTFVGWYTGTSSGPDYANGYITDKETLNYIPRKNTYIYAVGTRNFYINGSQYITGSTKGDWNLDSNNVPHNFKMSFDPNLGTKGKYYWTITSDMYSRVSSTGLTIGGYKNDSSTGNKYYFNNDNSKGNSYFQFYDEATGYNQGSVWDNDTVNNDFMTEVTGKVKYGRVRRNDDWTDQFGVIQFKDATYPGYSAPITIYYDPATDAKGKFTVEPSYIYPNIYLSHGYEVGSTTRLATATGTYQSELKWMNGTTESSTNINGPVGNGWTPNNEGHVNHFKVQLKDATVRVKKTTHSNDKVVAFFVYDLHDNKVYAIRDVKNNSNTYYTDIKMQTGHDLYICPIIQVKNADMTVYFDASQLNSNRWGKIVSCYAWYGSGNAQGKFPGQPMIPSDDGTSWVATFPSTKNGSELAGITFSNYIDKGYRDNVLHGHSWLAETGVMPTVTDHKTGAIDTSNSILKFKYNDMGTDDKGNTDYRQLNCKVQTYDYREPISYYKNHLTDQSDDITLTFAIKMGNSDSVMSLRHSELKTKGNIFSGITHTHSDGTTSTHTFTAKNFQYLTNAKGDKYTDLNGNTLDTKPTATYYVISKGEAIYDNSNLKQVFWSGKRNESRSSLTYYGENNSVPTGAGAVNETYPISGVSMDYGVEWYIYDASGNYITNILSAGYADYASSTNKDSVIGNRLKELGYAVDGKAVAICYDKPRYMYGDDTSNNVKYINSGSGFDSFRATGQWYKNEAYQTVTVSAGVGMMTDSGEVIADSNDGGYGKATAAYDMAKGTNATLRSYAEPTPLGSEYGYVTTAQKDAVNQPIRLTATSDNFIGWYYYDPGTKEFTKASYTDPTGFYPNYTKDIIYYAMYRAAAIYKYKYQGREGDDYYTVGGGDLTSAELKTSKVDKNETIRKPGQGGKFDITALAPGADKISVFKKTLNFSGLTDYDNSTNYQLEIGTATKSVSSYTLTYYYPSSKGGEVEAHTITKEYNTTVDLSSCNVGSYADNGKVFMGWYEFDPNKSGDERYGNLLTTQSNYGFVVTKDQTVAARYGSAAATDTGWKAFIDDNGITKEMTSASSGRFYNDTIVRFRNGTNAAENVPKGAEVGVLVLNDGKTGGNITVSNNSTLDMYANAMSNNDTRKIGTAGKSVTKLCLNVGNNGEPLTYYNRFDFALKGDYTATVGSNYNVYAYVKIGSTYYWSAVASGTYE